MKPTAPEGMSANKFAGEYVTYSTRALDVFKIPNFRTFCHTYARTCMPVMGSKVKRGRFQLLFILYRILYT
jgi:hypothetical protein